LTTRHKVLTVKTPEGIVFSLRLASPLRRFLALAVDKACVYIVSGVVSLAVRFLGIISADLAGAFWFISSFVLSVGYPIAFEWSMRGQTPGKKLLRLQVMDEQGLQLHFGQIVIRNLLRFIDAMPAFYLVGGSVSLLTARAQRIGDVAANTIVVQHPRLAQPDLDQLLPGKYNSFRDHPHLAARLRQNVSPAEASVALQSLLRRDALDPDARLTVYAAVKKRLSQKVSFPPEVTDGISDEQYVRNAVDILFRQSA
jgi:uncharacterized RDD family membrane protein YckC